MIDMKAIDDVVFAAPAVGGVVTRETLAALEQQAWASGRGQCRLLLHGDRDEILHEMVIAVVGQPYIRPHINERGAKSFHLLRGEMMVVVFENEGSINHCTALSGEGSEGDFLFRLSKPMFHTIIPMTESVIFIETALGPHRKTRYADWAPVADGGPAAEAYVDTLWRDLGLVDTAKPSKNREGR